jgi:hypothetical protein
MTGGARQRGLGRAGSMLRHTARLGTQQRASWRQPAMPWATKAH